MNQTDHNTPEETRSTDERRITLIMRGCDLPERAWDYSSDSSRLLMFIHQFPVLEWAVSSRVGQSYLDIERVIIDRAASPAEFLGILSRLAPEFRGDIVFIGEGDCGYLSAMGRGGDRVLYATSADDTRFYLDAHRTVGERAVSADSMYAAAQRRQFRIVAAA